MAGVGLHLMIFKLFKDKIITLTETLLMSVCYPFKKVDDLVFVLFVITNQQRAKRL